MRGEGYENRDARYLIFGGNFDGGVVLDALDTMVRIQVLVQGDLEGGRTSLAVWKFR
jgi:hypothetical protein